MTNVSLPEARRKAAEPFATHSSTDTDPAGWRAWWAIEARRCGTDWISLVEVADRVLRDLRAVHVTVSS